MKFKSGMLGACIVVVALLCSVIAGFTLGVEDREESVLKYNTITDVTGQFSASRSPYYADYTPSQNYTGYTPGSVSFTETSVANPYRITVEPGTTSVTDIDLTNIAGTQSASNTYAEPSLINPEYITVKALLEGQGVNIALLDYARIDLFIPPDTVGSTNPNETYGVLSNWVQANPNAPSGNSKWDTGGGSSTNNYSFDTNLLREGVLTPSSVTDYKILLGREVDYLMKDGVGYPTFRAIDYYDGNGHLQYVTASEMESYACWLEIDSNGTVVCKETVRGVTSVRFTKDYGSCYLTWSDYVTGKPRMGGAGVMQQVYLNYMPGTITHNIKLTTTINGDYAYMKIGDGVGLESGYNTTSWANSYTNGSVDILFRLESMTGYDFNVFCAGATVNVSTNGSTVLVNSDDMGAWSTFMLRFNCQTKEVSFIPVTSFGSFQEYTLSDTSVPVDATITDDNTTGFTITRAGGSVTPKWSVGSTTVWMDTYGIVMVNPSVDLRSYFPSDLNPYLGLEFSNVSVVGDSITINGETYPVENGSYITVNDKQLNLKGLTVYYTPDGVQIGNGSTKIDVGAVADTTVSLAGSWYFLTNALNGSYQSVTQIDWDVGHWATTYPQTVIIFLGLLIGSLLVAKHYNKVGTMDYIVVVFAGLIGLLVVY